MEIFKDGRVGMKPMLCQSLRLDAMGFDWRGIPWAGEGAIVVNGEYGGITKL